MRSRIALLLAPVAIVTAVTYAVSSWVSAPSFPRPAFAVEDMSSATGQALAAAARAQIGVVTAYSTEYYARESIPPESGACADVIWRALERTGYDLPAALAADLSAHPEGYPSTPAHDPHVDFRRVKMVRAYLERHAESLSTAVVPRDAVNLAAWQAGDIVTFAASRETGGLEHIAIVSSTRDADGVPAIIHNYGQGTREMPHLLTWPSAITGHYRLAR